MRRKPKNYNGEEKLAILRRHLPDKVPESRLCGALRLQPTLFCRWQQGFFARGAAYCGKDILPSRMVYAILDGMTIKIDKAGRIVLPKPLRERFHLREGSELELEERPDGVTLRPVEQRSSMAQEKGVWVHLGKVPRGFDWGSVVEAIRDERIKDASGI